MHIPQVNSSPKTPALRIYQFSYIVKEEKKYRTMNKKHEGVLLEL